MNHYYCTCSLDPKKEGMVKLGRTPYRKVLTCADGICNNCNHYAVATRREVNPASGQLYAYLTGMRTKAQIAQYKHNYFQEKKLQKEDMKYANRN
jgi:hypothetical protein